MFWLRLGYLFLAMVVCSVGLGIGIARRIVRKPRLILPIAIGLSGIVLYLAAWVIFVSHISWQWSYAVTGLAVLGLILDRRELRRIFLNASARGMLLAWLVLELWVVLLELYIRHWAIWVNDWLEHYDRAKFFLQHWYAYSVVQGNYLITARPPMMNVIESLFMAQTGPGYEFFQVVSAFFNVTLFIAVAALAAEWTGKKVALATAALLALNPWFIQNSTYTWTKLYCAFYVVLGVWLYWRSFRPQINQKSSRRLRSLSLVMLAGGCVVHYSAAIYAVFLAVHDLIHGRGQFKRIFATWFVCAALMATWFGWAWVVYGFTNMAGTNTTVTDAKKYPPRELIENFEQNAVYSLVPREIWQPNFATIGLMSQHNTLSQVSDAIFMIYEPALLLAWGLGGAFAMGWSLWKWGKYIYTNIFARPPRDPRIRPHRLRSSFWIAFLLWGYIAGLLSDTSQVPYYGGVAHILFQPIVWIGMAWLISALLCAPSWLARVWAAGLVIDAAWLLLHIGLQGRLMAFVFENGGIAPVIPDEGSHVTMVNNIQRILHHLSYLGDRLVHWQGALLALMICGAAAWWWCATKLMGRDSSLKKISG